MALFLQEINRTMGAGFQFISERLYVCNMPVGVFSSLKSPLAYVLTWNRKHIDFLDKPQIIYDFVDDILSFSGNSISGKELVDPNNPSTIATILHKLEFKVETNREASCYLKSTPGDFMPFSFGFTPLGTEHDLKFDLPNLESMVGLIQSTLNLSSFSQIHVNPGILPNVDTSLDPFIPPEQQGLMHGNH